MTAKARCAAFVFLALGAGMAWAQSADVKVSALSDAAPADGTELLYVAQMSASEGSRSQKLDIDDLSSYVLDLIGLTSASTVCEQDGTGCPAAGAGSVTSVAATFPDFLTVSGSPITTTGTLAVTLATQPAGRVFAGPASGADAAPGFRDLVATDIPALSYLTGITGEELADLSDVSAKSGTGTVVVTTTGAQTSGDCVEIDASGNHIASGAACGGGGGAVSIADLTSGTNTTMAGVIGSGASLAVSGSGTIAATTATSATNAAGIDSDADGTREVWGATVSTHPSVCLGPGDAGTCQARLSNYSGGSLYTPFVFSGGLFLGTSADAAESQWWARPLTSTRLQIMNMVYATALEIGHDGTRPYFSLYGAVYYGASATPPTCSTDGSVYTDTTEGSGLAAQCVCLDGTWEVMAGAGGCGTP